MPQSLTELEPVSSYLGVLFQTECTLDLKYKERKFVASSTR
jgi:hypothetical protein